MPNKENVRTYYTRHKDLVVFRKVMRRARTTGSVPTLRTVCAYDIPVQAVLVAFADWAAHTENNELIRRQKRKLDALRVAVSAVRPMPRTSEPTPEERRALVYLRRITG